MCCACASFHMCWLVVQGNRAEAIPLSAWYDFQPKMRKTKLSVEEVERTVGI